MIDQNWTFESEGRSLKIDTNSLYTTLKSFIAILKTKY